MEFNAEDFKLFTEKYDATIHRIEIDALPHWVYPTAIRDNLPGITHYVKNANLDGIIQANTTLTNDGVTLLTGHEYVIYLPWNHEMLEMTEYIFRGLSDPFSGIQTLSGECNNSFVNKYRDVIILKMHLSYDTAEGKMNDYLYFGIKLKGLTISKYIEDKNLGKLRVISITGNLIFS